MFSLYPDVYLTRRQRLHYVMDGNDVLMWSGNSIFSAVEYLLNENQGQFLLDTGDGKEKLHLTVRKV